MIVTASIAFAVILLTSALSLIGLPNTQYASATFLGENGKIAFVSDRDRNNEIYVMNADGTEQMRLTTNLAGDTNPSWSSDGSKIVFESDRDDNSEIYVMNADGTEQMRLTNNTARDVSPSWSPDDTKIAFVRDGAIFVMNSDGGDQTKLTSNLSVISVSWSPNGTKLAFWAQTPNPFPGSMYLDQIYVINVDGSGEATNITNRSDVYDLLPDWSPDGTKVTFTGGGSGRGPCCSVLTMNADGTNPEVLEPGVGWYRSSSWSPDGTKIVFAGSHSAIDQDFEIYVVNADGSSSAPTRLTFNNAREDNPSWQPRPTKQQFTLTVNAVDLSDNPVNGMWTTIRTSDGALLKSEFTPLTFIGNSDAEYKVSVANYDGRIFQHWENGSTSKARTINNLSGNKTLTATFDQGDSIRGFSSLTYTGSEEQPDLTVDAKSLDGSRTLHMWTIIDPQSNDASGTTTYKVYASNYKDRVFDHWEDGSTDRVRSLTVEEATTITAYYKTGES